MEFPVKSLITPIAIALAAIGCSTAFAAEDPMKLKMVDLEARLIRIERVIENQSLIQLAAEVDMLRSESMQLRGEIETLRYETENSNKRQRDLYVDVDRRLQAIEQGQQRGFAPTPAPPPAAAPQATPPPPERAAQPPAGEAPRVAAAPARPAGTDQQNYQAAFELMQGRKYEEAGRSVRAVPRRIPAEPARGQRAVLARRNAVRARAIPARARGVPKGPRSLSAVGEAARRAAQGRLLSGRARQPRGRAHRAPASDAVSSPTPRPRGSRRSGSSVSRNSDRE